MDFHDIGDDARRQYIDARATFEALEAAETQAAGVRGGMYWKTVNGVDYLIRTSTRNAQKAWAPEALKPKPSTTASSKERKQLNTGSRTWARQWHAISA